MVCNLALSRAYIGFFAGAALYLAAAVAEAALLSAARPELEKGDEARLSRRTPFPTNPPH